MSQIPSFQGYLPIKKYYDNICCHPSCDTIGSKCCPECEYVFCNRHSYHWHFNCCVIDNGVKCPKDGTNIDSNGHVMCLDHFLRMVYPVCSQCGKPNARKDYLFCEECRDDRARKCHGYWYALREKGVNGPYGDGFKVKN